MSSEMTMHVVVRGGGKFDVSSESSEVTVIDYFWTSWFLNQEVISF